MPSSTTVTLEELLTHGVQKTAAEKLLPGIQVIFQTSKSPTHCWQRLCHEILPSLEPFHCHQFLHEKIFKNWKPNQGPAPVWIPTWAEQENTHLSALMKTKGFHTYSELLEWSKNERLEFWEQTVRRIGIQWKVPYQKIADLKAGPENPIWFPGGKINIVDSCFKMPPNHPAILSQSEKGTLQTMNSGDLQRLTFQISSCLQEMNLSKGDAIAVDLPMTAEAVAIYLGIIHAGCAVVSIADSFAPHEIQTRLNIANTKLIFTQDFLIRGGKALPLYEKVLQAQPPRAIVLKSGANAPKLRSGDLFWEEFLESSQTARPESVSCDPHDTINILFSSGTTGEPKAIPWNHATAVKCASDAYYHHDIQPGNVLSWPTNLGWMMGPWLIFAALMNKGTLALYDGAPQTRGFGEFIQNAKVQMLGVVPSLVKTWRTSRCMEGLRWKHIRLFSSTGECSNTDDMFYLMSLAGYRPIIEYCGGTEIGGGYITSTLLQNNAPGTFTTPALGLDFCLLSEEGKESNTGEVFLIPPSMGLSLKLLNRDHHTVYFQDTPPGPKGQLLRRHGDQMENLGGGYYRAHGRVDDTMNLGGIKVSSAEIETVVNGISNIVETAAIAATPPGGGPSLLILFVVLRSSLTDAQRTQLQLNCQKAIKEKLNPLFRVHEVIPLPTLPRTASNKVMRRTLREQYDQGKFASKLPNK